MFGHHILKMYLRHRLTKTRILRRISLATSHVSHPYKSTDFTRIENLNLSIFSVGLCLSNYLYSPDSFTGRNNGNMYKRCDLNSCRGRTCCASVRNHFVLADGDPLYEVNQVMGGSQYQARHCYS